MSTSLVSAENPSKLYTGQTTDSRHRPAALSRQKVESKSRLHRIPQQRLYENHRSRLLLSAHHTRRLRANTRTRGAGFSADGDPFRFTRADRRHSHASGRHSCADRRYSHATGYRNADRDRDRDPVQFRYPDRDFLVYPECG